MNTAIKERPIFEMIPVVSSQIASIGHDAASNMLAIQFPEKKGWQPGQFVSLRKRVDRTVRAVYRCRVDWIVFHQQHQEIS